MMHAPLKHAPPPASPLAARTLEIAETAGGLVTFLAPARFPAGPVLIEGRGDTDWVVLDARRDPHVAAGTMAIPRGPRRHLERIAATGAAFDALLVGHELPAGTVAKLDRKGAAVPAAGKTDRPSATPGLKLDELLGPPPADRTAERTVAIANAVIAAAKRAAVGTGRTFAQIGTGVTALFDLGLDPVVFGAVAADGPPKPGELVAVFHLVQWS